MEKREGAHSGGNSEHPVLRIKRFRLRLKKITRPKEELGGLNSLTEEATQPRLLK
jgi:hypothetical protein